MTNTTVTFDDDTCDWVGHTAASTFKDALGLIQLDRNPLTLADRMETAADLLRDVAGLVRSDVAARFEVFWQSDDTYRWLRDLPPDHKSIIDDVIWKNAKLLTVIRYMTTERSEERYLTEETGCTSVMQAIENHPQAELFWPAFAKWADAERKLVGEDFSGLERDDAEYELGCQLYAVLCKSLGHKTE